MLLIDPRHLFADPDAAPFYWDSRIDLTASDVPTTSGGDFVVFDRRVPQNQIWLIKTMMPHVYARTDVGTAQESYRPLTAQEANGYFSWELLVENQSVLMSADYNNQRLAGAAQNSDRSSLNGVSTISADPHGDAFKSWNNPLFTVKAASDRRVRVIFRIRSLGAASPIPNGYVVGGAVGSRRVDDAACLLTGAVVQSQTYDKVANKLKLQ